MRYEENWDDRWSELDDFAMAYEIAVVPFTEEDYLEAFCDFYEVTENRDLELVRSEDGLYKCLEDFAGDERGDAVASETERLFGMPTGMTYIEDEEELLDEISGVNGLAPFFFVFELLFCEYEGFTLCFIFGTNN